jgi:maltooligosyltrehalose trehalohydrolase
LPGAQFGKSDVTDVVLTAHWTLGDGTILRLLANLSDEEIASAPRDWGTSIWGGTPGDRLPPWSVFWSIGG